MCLAHVHYFSCSTHSTQAMFDRTGQESVCRHHLYLPAHLDLGWGRCLQYKLAPAHVPRRAHRPSPGSPCTLSATPPLRSLTSRTHVRGFTHARMSHLPGTFPPLIVCAYPSFVLIPARHVPSRRPLHRDPRPEEPMYACKPILLLECGRGSRMLDSPAAHPFCLAHYTSHPSRPRRHCHLSPGSAYPTTTSSFIQAYLHGLGLADSSSLQYLPI